MISREIFSLRKSEQSTQALALARDNYSKNSDDIWFIRAYGWALYDHIKQAVEKFENKNISIGGLNTQLKNLMSEFANIAQPLRGDLIFSHVLRLAGKVSTSWDDFLSFARWAGLQDFTEEDKRPFITEDGKKIDSLEKRFARAICKQTAIYAAHPNAKQDLLEWGKQMLEGELLKNPDDQWLNYYHCKIYLANNQYSEALNTLGPILRRQSRAAWVWDMLAEILEKDRQQDAITCLVYATQLARKEQEVGRVRIKLASLLALNQQFAEAAYHAKLALEYRDKNGYRVPEELAQLLTSDWYKEIKQNNGMIESSRAEKSAKKILFELELSNLNYTLGVVENTNQQKKLTYVATGVDSGVPIFHNQHSAAAKLQEGTIVELGIVENTRVIDYRISSNNKIEGFCEEFQGEYDHKETNSFAFINSGNIAIFVPPHLASIFETQHTKVKCLAIKKQNKQGKVGWRALKLFLAN